MSTFTRRDWLRTASAAALTSGGLHPRPARAAAPTPADVKAVVDPAVKFLASKQNEDGSLFPKGGGPGITALAVAAVVRHGYGPDTPLVAKGLKYLEGNIKPDGGVYAQGLATYTTCLAIVAFKECNAGGKYDKVIDNASKFVRSLQYGEGVDQKDLRFGGAGYGKPGGKDRPDLSNTQFLVEALTTAGAPKTDPAIQKALTFISRSQNLPGEHNDQPFAAKASDDDKGGFVYNPLDQSNDKSDKRTPAGGLRSEGGMTYAGLKSFLYAGVGKDDPRVKAAVAWVKAHYTLSENPGQGAAGLFYYYHTFAKAMDALGEEPFEDAKGVKHDWRAELLAELKRRQKPDGSWANDANGAFLENVPELATAFAVLALSYCNTRK
ncbi:MAG: terpene cyclase/mutase family protein [Gemmataceae bacterium]|nr:terpene cyclase/mutase family protein [Gemmataceae bacterium]MBY0514577.1 terpene cyclase/mutase family protein [Gemmataceae bacterium]